MDLHDYTLWLLLQDRHAEIVAAAQRDALLWGATRPRRPFRAALGTALMRLGAWLLREHHPAPAELLGHRAPSSGTRSGGTARERSRISI